MATGAAADGAGAGSRRAAPAGLVGRDDLLAQLRRAADGAAAGRGGLVLLTGEAGIGKTALATAAATDAEGRGARVAWGWGWQGEGAPAWWPWVQVLRSLTAADERLRRLAAELPWPARLLPDLPGAAPPPVAGELAPAARFRLLDELTSVLLAAAVARPLVVVLDDLQWADPPSLELLGFLARRLPGARVLVLGTWRELDQPPDDPRAPLVADLAATATVMPLVADLAVTATVMPMRALGDEEVARLVTSLLGAEPEPGLVADVRRRTGGNPFFVQQVTRLLAAGGPAGIPFGVGEAIPAAPGPPDPGLPRPAGRGRRGRAGVHRHPARPVHRAAGRGRPGPALRGRPGPGGGGPARAPGALPLRPRPVPRGAGRRARRREPGPAAPARRRRPGGRARGRRRRPTGPAGQPLRPGRERRGGCGDPLRRPGRRRGDPPPGPRGGGPDLGPGPGSP